MKRTKRSLALLLSLLLMLSLFPQRAFAAEAEELPEETVVSEPAETIVEQETAGNEQETAEEEQETTPDGQQESAAEQESGTESPVSEQPALAGLAQDEDAEDADLTVEVGQAPSVETEEPAEAAQEPEEASTPEETGTAEPEEEEEFSVQQPVELYAPGEAEGDGGLLDQYAQKQLDSLTTAKARRLLRAARDPAASLEGVNRTVYLKLKDAITLVANGEQSSSVFTIPVEELGLSQTIWTKEELGLDTLITTQADGTKTFTAEAMAAVNAKVGFQLRFVVNSLQSACPYELYWYDKTVGTALQSYKFAGNSSRIRITGAMTFTFAVSRSYSDGSSVEIDGVSYRCGVDSSYGERISSAVENAAGIVNEYAAYGDYEKLKAYKNRICALVSYDDAASGHYDQYGDPWQIISVFDGDPTTNVVCEGYAKAFQYLCDQSVFSGSVTAWCVSGTMQGGTGAGAHMWNLVRMEDGKVYLADVTNCDAGTIGCSEGLFLVGFSSGSVNGGYTFTVGGKQIRYSYDEKMLSLFSEEELTVASAPYSPQAQRVPGVVENMEELLEDLANGVTEIRFNGTGSFLVSEDVSIPAPVQFTLGEGTLVVFSGVSMSVASGAVLTAQRAQIDGTLSVSGTFRLLQDTAPLAVNGLLQCETGGGVYVRDPSFRRSGKMKTGGGYYYVEQEPTDEAGMRSAVAAAAASGDSALLFRILPRAAISLSADLTLPKYSRVVVDAPYSLTPAQGATLTNAGKLTVYQSFAAPGRIVNNDVLTLAKNVTASFDGGYTGTGKLRISKDAQDPFAQVLCPDASVFDAARGKDGFWELTLKSFTLRFETNGGSGSFDEQTALYGSVLSLGAGSPVKNGFRFLGWASAADASAAEWQPGGRLTLTGDLTLYAVWEEDTVSFAYADSVTFKGELKLNFYLKLSQAIQQDANAYAVIRFNGQDTTIPVSQARRSSVGGVSCHVFALPVVAKQMREEATLRLFTGSGEAAVLYVMDRDITETGYTSSVMAYLVKTQQTSANPKMVALAKAAEDYGTAAQIYFDYKADGLAVPKTVTDVKLEQLSGFAPTYASEKTSGMDQHYASVMFKSDNTLRQYFTFKSGQKIGDYSFTVDTKPATPVYSAADRYYVALPNIAAKDLDTPHAYTVSCGGETYAFTFSALSYAYQIMQVSTNGDMINLAKALYLYNQAANAYFG